MVYLWFTYGLPMVYPENGPGHPGHPGRPGRRLHQRHVPQHRHRTRQEIQLGARHLHPGHGHLSHTFSKDAAKDKDLSSAQKSAQKSLNSHVEYVEKWLQCFLRRAVRNGEMMRNVYQNQHESAIVFIGVRIFSRR